MRFFLSSGVEFKVGSLVGLYLALRFDQLVGIEPKPDNRFAEGSVLIERASNRGGVAPASA
jgi:hypothetical protein